MLLDTLIAKQRELRENDYQFAARLSIPRATWQLTRTRVKPLGRRVALAARRAFPEMESKVVSFLLSDATGGNDSATCDTASVA